MTDIDALSNTGARAYRFPQFNFPLKDPNWVWEKVYWRKIESSVDNLHSLLYKAFKAGRFNMARKLGKLLLRSSGNILLNVRRVSQDR